MKVLNAQRASKMGYSNDKRKRRRQHRRAAKQLMGAGTLFNPGRSPRGSIPGVVAQWHLFQARWVGR